MPKCRHAIIRTDYVAILHTVFYLNKYMHSNASCNAQERFRVFRFVHAYFHIQIPFHSPVSCYCFSASRKIQSTVPFPFFIYSQFHFQFPFIFSLYASFTPTCLPLQHSSRVPIFIFLTTFSFQQKRIALRYVLFLSFLIFCIYVCYSSKFQFWGKFCKKIRNFFPPKSDQIFRNTK